MTTLLTTQEVQDLLHVDRSTVYRMAEDGRLPSVKVGRQWRFPADRMAEQLGTAAPTELQEEAAVATDPGGRALPSAVPSGSTAPMSPEAAQAIASFVGDLFGVMAVVTDADGNPLSEVANPCGLYAAIADEPGTADACLAEWRTFAERSQMAQRFSPSHLGFLCTRTFLWVDRRPVAMVLVGGLTPPEWPPSPDRIDGIADSIGVPAERIASVVDQTFDVDADRQRWMLDTLGQLGDLLSMFLGDQLRLRSTIDAIAGLAAPATTPALGVPVTPSTERTPR